MIIYNLDIIIVDMMKRTNCIFRFLQGSFPAPTMRRVSTTACKGGPLQPQRRLKSRQNLEREQPCFFVVAGFSLSKPHPFPRKTPKGSSLLEIPI